MVRCSANDSDKGDKAVGLTTGAAEGMADSYYTECEAARTPKDSGHKSERKQKKAKKSQVEDNNPVVGISNEDFVDLLNGAEIEKSPSTKEKRKHHSKLDQGSKVCDVNKEPLPEMVVKNKKKHGLEQTQEESAEHKKRKKTVSTSEENDNQNEDNLDLELLANVKATDGAHGLLERISVVLKMTKDDVEDHRITLKNFDWHKVSSAEYSAEECKRFCFAIIRPLRKFRTLAELIDEAKLVKKIRCRIHKTPDPDLPKRPTNPLFLFLSKKRKSYQRKYPDLRPQHLTKLMSEKFSKMSVSRKQKYVDAYQKAKDIFDQQMKEYREIHKTAPIAKKTMSAAEYYVHKKSAKKLLIDGANRGKILSKYQQRWKSLPVEEKVSFIRKALKAKARKQGEQQVDLTNEETSGSFMPNIVLTKIEQTLINKADGVVSHPTNSKSYALFAEKFASEKGNENGESSTDLLNEAAAAWQVLSDEERLHYVKEARKIKVVEKAEKREHDKKKLVQLFKNEPKNYLNVYSVFIRETIPTLSHLQSSRERMMECSRMWSTLSASDKEVWKNKLLAGQKDYEERLKQFKQGLSDELLVLYEEMQKKKKKRALNDAILKKKKEINEPKTTGDEPAKEDANAKQSSSDELLVLDEESPKRKKSGKPKTPRDEQAKVDATPKQSVPDELLALDEESQKRRKRMKSKTSQDEQAQVDATPKQKENVEKRAKKK